MEKNQQQSRRAFLSQTGKLTTACAVIGLTGGVAQAAAPASSACIPESTPMTLTDSHYWLSDVRLEDGFEYDGETVIGTRTALYQLEISNASRRRSTLSGAGPTAAAGIPRHAYPSG